MTSETTLEDFPHRTFDKLRYGDTDRQGHINNAVFATFFETGRCELLLTPGEEMTAPNCAYVIARIELDYKAEVNWPGTVEIGTRVAAIGRSSMTLEQSVFQRGKLVSTARSVIVQMDETTRKSSPLSPETIERLKAFSEPA